MSYKYNPIPEGIEVDFLEIIAPLFWTKELLYSIAENRKLDIMSKIPVGGITWIRKGNILYDKDKNELNSMICEPEYSVHIENNRYHCNFSSKCFKLVHTSTQKIRR